ncbi:FKBP-type peptidyl-prolyl cis-trans isomerase [Robiginitomaculum antarcticum]|uniref:FKBP-type peptidyl-prolyl cis-trans isomerase n=1 Tax=Robiginitomaculum antarcticum TaxID=437507 RepID=UPI000362EDCB|nr:FKBP-type peptidyl-prolyl cis-trans isomerase [Robiginitomaculum antarcticum]
MKNLFITTALGAALALTACGKNDDTKMDDGRTANVEVTDIDSGAVDAETPTAEITVDETPSTPDVAVTGQTDLQEAQKWMRANGQREGVITTPSGLQYTIRESGDASGPLPAMKQKVKVHYEGKLRNGDVFDSSIARNEPVVFPVGGLIPGWNEALQMMRPGDIWTLYIPPALAYGAQGVPNRGAPGYLIPPHSPLIFRLEMIEVGPK